MIRYLRPKIIKNIRFYHKNIIDHYESPRNVGSLDKSDKTVGTGLVGAPACGDVLKIQIKVNDSGIAEFVDGDTFWVGDGSEKGLKIRLIGVNTPETVHPQKPVEFYGKEASNYVKSVLTDKKVKQDTWHQKNLSAWISNSKTGYSPSKGIE